MIEPGLLPLIACAVVYAVIALVIAVRSVRMGQRLLAAACLVTAIWAWLSAYAGNPMLIGIGSAIDLLRASAWFAFLYHMYRTARLGRPLHEFGFAVAGLVAGLAGSAAIVIGGNAPLSASIFSLEVASRLGLAVTELLLIENLYLNLPDEERWHVALPSVLLGGLACFDIVLCADLALFHSPSGALLGGRTIGMLIMAPLLLVASTRGRRWSGRVRLSRTAVFHSATLVLSGGVLIVLAGTGELLQVLDGSWGWATEASLAFAALLALGLMLTSGSARSRFQRLIVDHFFAERYDYRQQWLSCIGTLSGNDETMQNALPMRVIRAMAAVVDSPSGILFLREGDQASFGWAGSWNMRSATAIPPDHPVVAAVRRGAWISRLDGPQDVETLVAPLDGLGPLWLAVPLVHRGQMLGLVLLGPSRAPFPLEQEVYDLLRIVSQEVATYAAEQRATQTLLQTKQLHDYSKRFAFVAHDIKNVSSQLALLLSNAQSHISNPAFQKDMLDTVGSSVRKITALLERLERPEVDLVPATLVPLPRLQALVGTYRRVRQVAITIEDDGSTGTVAMAGDAFETAVTHLLNNAVEASGSVAVRVRHEVRQVVVDVVDTGAGMSPEFVRDKLFQPFSTSKRGGSGIGAFQVRELVRAAGGDLLVVSAEGTGTTMRILLPRTDTPGPAAQGGRGPAGTMPDMRVGAELSGASGG